MIECCLCKNWFHLECLEEICTEAYSKKDNEKDIEENDEENIQNKCEDKKQDDDRVDLSDKESIDTSGGKMRRYEEGEGGIRRHGEK